MRKIKNENAITIISLTLTVIITLLLAGVTVNIGLTSIDETKDRKLESECEIVHHAVLEEYVKAKQLGFMDSSDIPLNFIGEKLDFTYLDNVVDPKPNWVLKQDPTRYPIPTEAYKFYYKLEPEDLEQLEIRDAKHTYIVNYYTGEVYNMTVKETSQDKLLYIASRTLDDIIEIETPATVNTDFSDGW